MSTKTTFKRIALVAVAALGLGVLSVAPSSAQVSSLAITVVNGQAGNTAYTALDTTTAATVNVTALFGAALDTMTVQLVRKSKPTLDPGVIARFAIGDTGTTGTTVDAIDDVPAVSYSAGIEYSDSQTVTGSTMTTAYTITGGAGYKDASFGIFFETGTAPAAGTYTYTVIATATNSAGTVTGTAITDVSITVGALASASTTVAVASSTAYLNAGTGTTATEDASVSVVSTAAATTHATIEVTTMNAAGSAAAESITATISGPGLICDGSTCGKSLVIAGDGSTSIGVRADGTAGVATITVKTTTVTFATKSVTFFAVAASAITAATNQAVIGVVSATDVIRAVATDAAGTVWGGQAYIVAATAADALIAGSSTPVACEFDTTYKFHACPVAGTAVGTASFKVIDASTVALATATSNAAAVTVSTSVAASAKISFDKSSYAPGEKAIITVSVLDAAGNALPAKTVANVFAAVPTVSSAFSGTAPTFTTAITIAGATSAAAGTVAGAQTYVAYMPFSSGDVTISATGSTGLSAAGRVAYTATASVVNSSVDAATDAANEATDAANAATDAALAAADSADAATEAAQEASDAVAELSTQVAALMASLKAQIKSLTNLVIKIQKKLK